MLEDVLGWAVVMVGAFVMKFTDFTILDPLMSIGVALFIFINAAINLKTATDIFLVKIPHGISVNEIKAHLCEIDGILDVHHVHVWSMDGQNSYATMHVVASGDPREIKSAVREELSEHGIVHVTIEFEEDGEDCHEKHCHIIANEGCEHCHHHHHHH